MKEKSVLVADYDERFIWLDGTITKEIGSKFKKILARMNRSASSPIFLYIRGIGGLYYVTIAMARSIEQSRSPICVVAHEFVSSGCFILTQAGHRRLAIAGTKFRFHPAALPVRKGLEHMEQQEIRDMLDIAKVSNAVQLSWFLRKGRPAEEICRLFSGASVISLPRAKKLGLIDDYFKESDFYKDRKIARKLIKANS